MKHSLLTILLLILLTGYGWAVETPTQKASEKKVVKQPTTQAAKKEPKKESKKEVKQDIKQETKQETKQNTKKDTKQVSRQKKSSGNVKGKVPAKKAAAKNWLNDDNLVFIHYPGNCRAFAKIGQLTKTEEWQLVSHLIHSKMEEAYSKIAEKNEATKQADQWLKEKLPQALHKKDLKTSDIIDAWYEHVRVTTLSINFKQGIHSPKEMFDGTLIFIIDFNPTPEKEAQDFILKNLHGNVIYHEKDAYIVKFPNPKGGDCFLGVTPIAKTSLFALITSSDEGTVRSRIVTEPQTGILRQLANTKEEKLSSISANLTFFKSIIEKSSSLMPEKNAEFLSSICSNIDSIKLSTEKGKEQELTINLKLKATSEASAKELNNMLAGTLSLIKMQNKKKEEGMKNSEKLVYQAIKNADFTCKKDTVSAKIQFSRELFDKIGLESLKECLKDPKNAVKDQIKNKIKNKITPQISK